MGYTPYKAQRMQSPMAQKSKSKKNWDGEDRNLTMEEVSASKDKTAFNEYEGQLAELSKNTSLSNNQKSAQNAKNHKQYIINSNKAQNVSNDSIPVLYSKNLLNMTFIFFSMPLPLLYTSGLNCCFLDSIKTFFPAARSLTVIGSNPI